MAGQSGTRSSLAAAEHLHAAHEYSGSSHSPCVNKEEARGGPEQPMWDCQCSGQPGRGVPLGAAHALQLHMPPLDVRSILCRSCRSSLDSRLAMSRQSRWDRVSGDRATLGSYFHDHLDTERELASCREGRTRVLQESGSSRAGSWLWPHRMVGDGSGRESTSAEGKHPYRWTASAGGRRGGQ